MSDSVRGIAIVLSVLLWSPVAPGLLRGEVPPEKAILLYGAALVLALVGCSLIAGLLRAYAPATEEAPTDEPEELGRRAEDALT